MGENESMESRPRSLRPWHGNESKRCSMYRVWDEGRVRGRGEPCSQTREGWGSSWGSDRGSDWGSDRGSDRGSMRGSLMSIMLQFSTSAALVTAMW